MFDSRHNRTIDSHDGSLLGDTMLSTVPNLCTRAMFQRCVTTAGSMGKREDAVGP